MFSCCLPVSRRRDLQNGSNESIYRRAHRWARTQPRRLWPFSRRDTESSSQVIEEQLVDGDPVSTSEGQVSHTMEGQGRPEVSVATWESVEPGPKDSLIETPPQKPPRLHSPPPLKPPRLASPLTLSDSNLEPHIQDQRTRSKNLEPKKAEPKAPAQEAELTSSLPYVLHRDESISGSDLGASQDMEGYLPPTLVPPPAATPAAALEPGPAWAASPDLAEAAPPLAEGPSAGNDPVPVSEEELPQDHPPLPAPEQLVELAVALPPEFVLPPLLDFFLLFSLIVMFSYSSQHG
uniref:Uncharacterized protein n=1 Tax=Molossus molossus TaxID=27622 RepID=A0A7J8EF98_MOLMO|nr:hypothetical protein HJG59_008901 [Molossus molossus]